MKMSKDIFIKTLIDESKKYDIVISNSKADKLYEYKELLINWNEKINLTAITDDYDIIQKHFIDSLLVTKNIEKNSDIIDVGTGAGFPGIVISIYFEEKVNIVLLDSLQKRIDFLNEVIEKLHLNNIKAIHGRAEEFAHNIEYREKFDVAIARAVAPMNILLEYLAGYVKKEGFCICMKSLSANDELIAARKSIEILKLKNIGSELKEIKYNEEILKRVIVILKKIDKLTDKYPRQFSKIKKNPL